MKTVSVDLKQISDIIDKDAGIVGKVQNKTDFVNKA